MQAVIRECQEEIGRKVEVRDLLHVREYIGSNHEFAEWDSDVHQVEFYFECNLADAGDTFLGHNPDEYQVGVEWIDLSALDDIRVYPRSWLSRFRIRLRAPWFAMLAIRTDFIYRKCSSL